MAGFITNSEIRIIREQMQRNVFPVMQMHRMQDTGSQKDKQQIPQPMGMIMRNEDAEDHIEFGLYIHGYSLDS